MFIKIKIFPNLPFFKKAGNVKYDFTNSEYAMFFWNIL